MKGIDEKNKIRHPSGQNPKMIVSVKEGFIREVFSVPMF